MAARAVGGTQGLRAEVRPSWGRLQPDRLATVLRWAGPRVLDVGCARGAYVSELMRRGYYAVGVDLMAWRSWRARFLLGDVSCLAIGDRMFDTVLAFEVLEHVPDLNAALAELRRVARRNIILSVPNCQPAPDLAAAGLTYHHWVDRTHRRFFTLESLEATLSASGLKVVQLRVFNPVKPMRLMASALGIPPVMVRPADRLLLAWPAGQRHHMSLLAVAEV